MTETEAKTAIHEAYVERYPEWKKIRIPTLKRGANDVFFAMVEAEDSEDEYEEVCLVETDGQVRIFDGTSDLVHNLAKMHSSRWDFVSPSLVSAVAFLATLFAIIGFTYAGEFNRDGMDALKGILALAAGFYFGNQAAKR